MNQFDKVKERVDIIKVFTDAGGRISKSAYSNQVMVNCPFHNDKHASMSINKDLKVFCCFTCSGKGDVFDLHSKMNDISLYDSLRKLAEEYSIVLDDQKNILNKRQSLNLPLELYNEVASIANSILINKKNIGYDYLISRGISIETMTKIKLGYISTSNDIYSLLIRGKFTDANLMKSGLFNNRKQFILANRVLFPVFNLNKQVIMFTGRALDDLTSPKYKHSVNKIVNKSETLYNSQSHHGNQQYKIVVEGPMDAIALYEKGRKNAVALLGKDISEYQYNMIAQLTKNVVVWLDNDNKHVILSAYKSFKEFSDRLINVKFALLEPTMDPFDYCSTNSISEIERCFVSFGKYFVKTISLVINVDNLFFQDELQEIFNEYAHYMSRKEQFDVKKALEEMYSCQLHVNSENIVDDFTLDSIGFKRDENVYNLYVREQNGGYFYLIRCGNIYRLLNMAVNKKFKDFESLNEEIVINDNQVVIGKNNLKHLKEYIEIL